MAEQAKPIEPKLSKFEVCRSGRPKKVVQALLAQERAKLEGLHVCVTEHGQKRLVSEVRFEKWVERWKADQRAAGLPTDPVEAEEYPYKLVKLDEDLVEEHRRQHYVIAALEDELSGVEEK